MKLDLKFEHERNFQPKSASSSNNSGGGSLAKNTNLEETASQEYLLPRWLGSQDTDKLIITHIAVNRAPPGRRRTSNIVFQHVSNASRKFSLSKVMHFQSRSSCKLVQIPEWLS